MKGAQMQKQEFGIYLNTRELKVVRINSPYWIPSGEEWIMITPEVNETLLNIREIVKQKELGIDGDKITWGRIPEFKK